MIKKFFAVMAAVIFLIQGVALAKKKAPEIPLEERLKIAVEVVDSTNFTELYTAKILRDDLINQLAAKNMFNLVGASDAKPTALKSLGEKAGASDVGDILIFSPAQNLNFRQSYYRNLGAQYVIRCEILGIGVTQGEPDTFDLTPGIGIGRERADNFSVGVGIFGGAASRMRDFYMTAVSVNLIAVDSGEIILRQNLKGRVLQRTKPSKGYDNASDESYLKSLDKTAEQIAKRISDYAAKNLSGK